MQNIKRLLFILVLVCAITAGGAWFYQTRIVAENAPATDGFTQVATVRQGSLSADISVVGELSAVQSQELAFDRLSGTTTLLTLGVVPGNTVEAGQVLATIDAATYTQALDQAESALQEARQVLADLETPATDLEMALADLDVAQAQLDAKQSLADFVQLLTTPDLTDLRSAVQDAQDNLKLAQLSQTLAERDSLAKSERDLQYAVDWHQRHIREMQALVDSGKANLEQRDALTEEQGQLADAQADLARVQMQRQVSRQAAAAKVATAQADLADAQEALAEAQQGSDALAVAEAQLTVRQAQVSLQSARASRDELAAGPDPVDLAAAKADVVKKELAVEEAKADLAAATLRAPFAGTILETDANAGDRITASSPILTLANLDELQVVASVDETTIRQVTAGQPVQITFDAFPGQRFQGQVLSVPLQGELQGGVMVYAVPISLEGAEALPLLVGMTANAEIQVGRAENALLVPTMALQEVGGSYRVLVPNSSDPAGTPQAVPVEVGISNGTYSQIVRGLNPGDQVLVQLQSADNGNFPFGGRNSGAVNGMRFLGRR